MGTIKSVTIISPGYPTNTDPYYPFVQQLAEGMANKGIGVTIVAPQSITHVLLHGLKKHPRKRVDILSADNKIRVFQPYYVTIPYRYKLFNNLSFSFVLKRSLSHLPVTDAYYAHFWQTGYNSYEMIKKIGRPLFVATGESEIEKMFDLTRDFKDFSQYISGVVAVSTKNKEESVRLGLTISEKCVVIPNAVDTSVFRAMNKTECRRQLSIPIDDFVVGFVGWFIERKGPLRVAAAINKVGGVKSLFIGKGNQDPQCDGILFKGSLPHEQVPTYLGAADCFVLPTLHEGCCNAVVEAMACGLPIISSNLPFNWDVLDSTNSIMIDPNNVDEIASAIRELKENKVKRLELAQGALKKAESLTIDKRAKAIIDFIESRK